MIIPDRKKAVSVILGKSMGPGATGEEHSLPEHAGEHEEILLGIAADLLHAIKIGSEKAVAQALRASFEHLEMQPHNEVEHEEEEHEE